MMATQTGNKMRVQVLLDPDAYAAMEREVQLRYMSESRCTISARANEFLKAHYAILTAHGPV